MVGWEGRGKRITNNVQTVCLALLLALVSTLMSDTDNAFGGRLMDR